MGGGIISGLVNMWLGHFGEYLRCTTLSTHRKRVLQRAELRNYLPVLSIGWLKISTRLESHRRLTLCRCVERLSVPQRRKSCKLMMSRKEVVFYLTQSLYQHRTGFTATSLYEPWTLTLFNALFTSLPIIFLGAFEQDLRASTLLAVPELYTKGQRSQGFDVKVFCGWMFTAVAQAMLIYFTAESLWAESKFNNDNGIYPIGVMTYTASVIIINIKLQIIEQRYKSILAFLVRIPFPLAGCRCERSTFTQELSRSISPLFDKRLCWSRGSQGLE